MVERRIQLELREKINRKKRKQKMFCAGMIGAVIGYLFIAFVMYDLIWFAPPATTLDRGAGLGLTLFSVWIAVFIQCESGASHE
jgi:hypothetical protein